MNEHYYLIIDANDFSAITKAMTPKDALNRPVSPNYPSVRDRGCEWRVFKGKADHHYLAYQFHLNGPMTNHKAHVVDLGPTAAYDTPGLSAERMPGGPGERYVPESVEDLLTVPDDPCAHCARGDGYDALVEHQQRHHEAEE